MTTARPNNICTRLAAKSGEAVAGELPATDVLTDGALVPAAAGGVGLLLPRLQADDPITAEDIARLGEGGLCLNCEVCHWPNCGFGHC